jgi:hypothetical protein
MNDCYRFMKELSSVEKARSVRTFCTADGNENNENLTSGRRIFITQEKLMNPTYQLYKTQTTRNLAPETATDVDRGCHINQGKVMR